MIDPSYPHCNSTGQKIVKEVREWIGTPYVHQASLKGTGTDCLGLIRGVWRALYGDEPQPVPAYSADWGEVGAREPLLTVARITLDELNIQATKPGDILIFRMRSNACAKHCAILSSDHQMIHAYSNHAVCEVPFTLAWQRKVAGVFRFPTIVEAD